MELLFVFPGKHYKYYDGFLKNFVVGIGYRIKKDLSGMEEKKRKKAISAVFSKRKKYTHKGLVTQTTRINSFFDKSLRYCIIPVKDSKELSLVELDNKIFFSEKTISGLTHFRKFKEISKLKNAGNYSNNVGVCRVRSEKIIGLDDEINNYKKKIYKKISELINDEELYGYEGETKEQLKHHKIKERDVKFSRDYRNKHRNVKSCPACSFDANRIYRIGEANSILEIHHIVPLKYFTIKKKTKESDVTFLCPNCHRAIHRLMSENEKKTISLKEFKKSFKK